ncbi:predicted protein [Pyrenophora tritici-repentis Pt-1C-BFP]|uniref:Uncharacterized protein n=1 Tax=Pyrenophora tritici-repentis (strain Pt-1C-BFP) TaxID=426418 RepID=B2W0M1_PYRTR|nr:uncharacterized protein PTRG_04006 [Pyrenophora tritici-repentis Pt-1C-BFP]EDU46844.1 predicted protein [Pyrenophora tritici-repentis Pt-1C-BFP]
MSSLLDKSPPPAPNSDIRNKKAAGKEPQGHSAPQLHCNPPRHPQKLRKKLCLTARLGLMEPHPCYATSLKAHDVPLDPTTPKHVLRRALAPQRGPPIAYLSLVLLRHRHGDAMTSSHMAMNGTWRRRRRRYASSIAIHKPIESWFTSLAMTHSRRGQSKMRLSGATPHTYEFGAWFERLVPQLFPIEWKNKVTITVSLPDTLNVHPSLKTHANCGYEHASSKYEERSMACGGLQARYGGSARLICALEMGGRRGGGDGWLMAGEPKQGLFDPEMKTIAKALINIALFALRRLLTADGYCDDPVSHTIFVSQQLAFA